MEAEILLFPKNTTAAANSSINTSGDICNYLCDTMQPDNISIENTSFDAANDSSYLRRSRGRDEELAKVEVAVLATIFALAVLGNVCVLVALGRRRKITSRMHMFILHLSVADLLVAFCNILPQLAWDITGTFRGGDALCRVVTFLQVFVMYLSTYVLVMTAIDRYRAICFPLSNYSWTPSTVNIMVTFVYLLSAVLSVPQPLLFKYQLTDDQGEYDCWANFEPAWLLQVYILTFTFLVYITPFLILVFTYGSICYTIWVNQPANKQQEDVRQALEGHSEKTTLDPSTFLKDGGDARYVCTTSVSTNIPLNKRWTPSRNNSSGSLVGKNIALRPRAHSVRGFSRAKLKTVKLTFVVTLAYLFCWSPFFISHIWWLFDPKQENNSAVVIMVLLSSLNSCCNPWIYLAFSGNLLRHIFPCLSPCCPPTTTRTPLFLLHTPSPLPQRPLEMLGFPMKKKGAVRLPRPQSSSPLCRQKGLHKAAGGIPGHLTVPQRPSSLTSLLTMRASRNTSLTRLQSQQPCLFSAGLTSHNRLVDPLQLSEKNRSMGASACDQQHSSANSHVVRKVKIPPDLIIQALNEDGASSPGGRESSSGSNPRSPHLFKRARLHERPAQEVAEAQLKWEHNMGIRRTSPSTFTFGVHTQ